MRGLEATFGKSDDIHLHALVPFEYGIHLGGSPDIVSFSGFTSGKLYVTTELIGYTDQKPNSEGNYELAIAHKGDEDWGVNIICRLAYYTLDNVLEHGETMDIANVTPDGSTIVALLFKRIASFQFQGNPANVICCIGITQHELDLCFKQGSTALLKKLPQDYVLTELYRESYA
ncbi:MAG: suppressor of fused domain protein [Candidatus Auribacterota bacterium]